MLKRIALTCALLALAGTASAADLSLKAPAQRLPVFYGGSGFYWGVGTGAEATKVGTTGVAVNPGTYEAGGLLNATVGYTRAVGIDRWAAVDLMYSYANTSANVACAPGVACSLDKKQSVDLTVMYGAPLSVLSTLFSNAATGFGALPTVGDPNAINSSAHPFILLGARYGNAKTELAAIAVPGLPAMEESHSKLRFKAGVGMIVQATNSSVIKTTVDWTFGSQNSGAGFLFIPGQQIKEGSTLRFTTSVLYSNLSLLGM